ncbi:MAG: MdtA/MuxA family multidrug efflux RND transporter periplasmic adaptor subunit [Pseudomonadota bacterium]|nr:MdtA/MuxA family multidrug efflux RND transporter periplasmic adaptor subunit [Pseudomonadota bacterium]
MIGNRNTSNASPKPLPFRHHYGVWGALLLVILLLILAAYFYFPSSQHTKRNTAVPVVVAVAKSADVPVYLSGLGSVIPTDTVTVKTQINGQLLQVLYKEGQMVKEGDLLAQIDPRPFEAQLAQYEGQLARDKALLANANLDLQRYKTLYKQDSVSQQVLDTQASLVKQLEGTVQLDEGQIKSTQLNLSYCRITAPVSGRVGLRVVDQGNYVQTSDPNGIVVINTINPITVVFAIPEDNVAQVMDQLSAGKTLVAEAYDRSQNKLLATGELLTVDNQIDPTTGTVKLKAQFPNEKNLLFPNQFVNIKLLVRTLTNATLIPTAAIQNGSLGTFVYLVDKNSVVDVRPVVAGVVFGEYTTIKSGIRPQQSVVIEGSDKLTDGAVVTTSTSVRHIKKSGAGA